MGFGSVYGDQRENRKSISSLPYNYKNTLTMKGGSGGSCGWQISLHWRSLEGTETISCASVPYFSRVCLAEVIHVDIPQIPNGGITLESNCFLYTYVVRYKSRD